MPKDKDKPFNPLKTQAPALYFEDPKDDEISKVTDMSSLFKKVEKVDRVLMRMAPHVSLVPEVKEKVEETATRVTRVEEKLEANRERVAELDKKVHTAVNRAHDCHQVSVIAEIKDSQREASQKIEKDIQKGIEMKAELAGLVKASASMESDVEEIKKTPQRLLWGILGLIVTIISGAGGAVWFLAELNKDVQFEREQRREQISRIESQIKTVATKADPAPIRQEISQLTKTVAVSNGYEEEFNRICDDMPPSDKRILRSTLSKRGKKRIPSSCLE